MGIVGLPNVGKSTLFNALTNAGAQSANYPFCTIEPNVGMVAVPDKRLDVLAEMYTPEKYTPATIEFVDIAGLVKGASAGEGLGNKFLSHIREVDAIVHVVRCFDDGDIIHVEGSVDPVRDVETINMELIFSDIEMLQRRADRVRKAMKGDRTLAGELDLCERVIEFLESGKCARGFDFTEDELELISQSPLLTLKPVIYAANVSEDDIADPSGCVYYNKLKELAESENSGIISVCASMEAEFAELEPEERDEFLADAGLSESGLVRLINESYSLLGLISFLTAGPKEVRAWTIKNGMTAPQAAGKIHSDFERGFIRAEIVSFDDLVRLGSINAAREAGLYRSEGKEYIMKDGDVVLFRFNV